MRRVSTWVRRIPVWVWLFLAATQVLTLVAAPARLSELTEALQRMPAVPAYAKVRAAFEESKRDNEIQVAGAAVLAPLFLGAALWRWLRRRSDAPHVFQPPLQGVPADRSHIRTIG